MGRALYVDYFTESQLIQYSSVQLSPVAQSCPTLCDPMIAAHQASLSITISRNSLKLMSIESVMSSSHHILCRPLLLLPPIPPSIRVFSNESTFRTRWPKYRSFSFSIIPSKEIQGRSPLEWTGWISLQSKADINIIPTLQMRKLRSELGSE